jgi:hypothetical protein
MTALTLVLMGLLLGVCLSALAFVLLIDWRQDQRDQLETRRMPFQPDLHHPTPPKVNLHIDGQHIAKAALGALDALPPQRLAGVKPAPPKAPGLRRSR